jgi:hypothetical protein
MQAIEVSREIGGRTLTIGTGTLAKLAAGAVHIQYGDTVVFGAVARANPREGIDFFPLQVDYRERRAAAGKFPGGFMKREGRPTTKEVASQHRQPLRSATFRSSRQRRMFAWAESRASSSSIRPSRRSSSRKWTSSSPAPSTS